MEGFDEKDLFDMDRFCIFPDPVHIPIFFAGSAIQKLFA